MVAISPPRKKKEEPGLINGQEAGSLLEWRVAVALWRYRWEFSYQEQLFGGRKNAGGIVVDFLVYTKPMGTPLFVDGEYWHGSAKGRERDVFLRKLIDSRFRHRLKPHQVLMGAQLVDQQSAYEAVFQMFGRG